VTAPMTPSAPDAPPVAPGVEVHTPDGLMPRRDTAAGPESRGRDEGPAAAPLVVRVHGVPAPQGSKRAFRNVHTGRIQQVESSKRVKPWRTDVKEAALGVIEQTGWQRAEGAVDLAITFVFARPKNHYGTGRNAHLLKDSAPGFPAAGPDLDKLVRSTADALGEAGAWKDDKQVVHVDAWKVYESRVDGFPGARIEVRVIDE
jgi:Holliday junction resolvase RusA-like endonuclease